MEEVRPRPEEEAPIVTPEEETIENDPALVDNEGEEGIEELADPTASPDSKPE